MTVPHPHSDFTAQVHKVHRVEEAGLPAATFLTLIPEGNWSEDLTFADGTVLLCLRDLAHRQVANGLAQPWLAGYLRHPFLRGWWKFVDIDPAVHAAAR